MEPNFIIIGAEKAGTTFLYAKLRQHPNVFMPDPPNKELYFFSKYYERGWEWYMKFFEHAHGFDAIGEATPEYSEGRFASVAAERIHQHLPDAQLIYIVRHPIERIASSYVQAVASGVEKRGFAEALRRRAPLIQTSQYWGQLSHFRERYRDSQILCLLLEDVRRDAVSVLTKCWQFLGVEDYFVPEEPQAAVNARNDLTQDRFKLIGRVRRSALAKSILGWVPKPALKLVKPIYRVPVRATVQWDRESLRYALDAVREDAQRFLAHIGREPNTWDLTPEYCEEKFIDNK